MNIVPTPHVNASITMNSANRERRRKIANPKGRLQKDIGTQGNGISLFLFLFKKLAHERSKI
jgi:hypothetical protein